jgi:hypothetical protein
MVPLDSTVEKTRDSYFREILEKELEVIFDFLNFQSQISSDTKKDTFLTLDEFGLIVTSISIRAMFRYL